MQSADLALKSSPNWMWIHSNICELFAWNLRENSLWQFDMHSHWVKSNANCWNSWITKSKIWFIFETISRQFSIVEIKCCNIMEINKYFVYNIIRITVLFISYYLYSFQLQIPNKIESCTSSELEVIHGHLSRWEEAALHLFYSLAAA